MAADPFSPALVVKSSRYAGLGDLIRSVLVGAEKAVELGRILCVDWRDTPYLRNGQDLFQELFEPPLIPWFPSAQLDNLSVNRLSDPPAWCHSLGKTLADLYAELGPPVWDRSWARETLQARSFARSNTADVLVLWDFCGQPLNTLPCAELVSRVLQPRSFIRSEVAQFQAVNWRPQMIGVHVRGAREQNLGEKGSNLALTLKALASARRRLPDAGLFLATDSPEAVQRITALYPDCVTRNKWMSPQGEALHLHRPQEVSGLEVARDALVDLLLLGACNELLYPAQSSFSITARLLAGSPGPRAIPIPALPAEHWPKRVFRRLLGAVKTSWR